MNNEQTQSSERLQRLDTLRSQYLDEKTPADQLVQISLDITKLVSELDSGEKRDLELSLKPKTESKKVNPVEHAISFAPTRADYRAMKRIEDARTEIAEDEVHVKKHLKEYKPWFLRKHPTGKVERPAVANQTTPTEQARIIDTEPEVKQDQLEDKNQIVAGEFTPEISEESGVAPAQIIDISDKVKRDEPVPEVSSISTEFGLDQKSDSISIEPKARVEAMASSQSKSQSEIETTAPVQPQAQSPDATENSDGEIESMNVKKSVFNIFKHLPGRGARSNEFKSAQEAAEKRAA